MGAVLLRTRFIDEYLLDQIKSGTRQVVNLGAGYDTRSIRFLSILHTTKIFEVDHPATQDRKRAWLKKFSPKLPDKLVFVPVRFNQDNLEERLVAAGFRTDHKTTFILEGVSYYISPEAIDKTLHFVSTNSVSGSSIVFDFFPPSVADGSCDLTEAKIMRARFKKFGEGITFGVFPDRMGSFLSQRGFSHSRIYTSSEMRKMYLAENRRDMKVSSIFSMAFATTI